MKTSTSCIERVLAAIESASGYSFDLNLVLKLAGRIDERILDQAIRNFLAAEPVHACRFQKGWWQPYWALTRSDATQHLVDIRTASDGDDALHEVLSEDADSRNASGLRVFLVRGAVDTLCLKLDHKLGDGQTLRLIGQKLAENYSGLLNEPAADSMTGSIRSRLVSQVMQDLPADEKQKILRLAVANKDRFDQAAQWKIPRPETVREGYPRKRFIFRRLSAGQGEAITARARQLGVSVNTVVLSMVMRGAVATVPREGGSRCEVIQTVDLRRHSNANNKALFGNFSSMIPISIQAVANDPLEALVPQVNAQLLEAKSEYLGLTHPLVRWEINPVRRFLFQCIPFRMLRRVTRRRLHALDLADSPGRLVFSNVGTVDPGGLTFGDVATDEAYFTAGVLTCRQMILLVATQFRGCWTIACAFSPRHMDETAISRFLDEVVSQVLAADSRGA